MTNFSKRLDYYKNYNENMNLLEEFEVKKHTTKANLIMSAAREATSYYSSKMMTKNDDRSDENIFNYAMRCAVEIIWNLQYASGKKNDDNFWFHKDAASLAEMIKTYDDPLHRIDREAVDSAVTEYLRSEIRFREFDRVATDMLVASELFGIMSHIKAHSGVIGFLFGSGRFKKDMVRCGKIAGAAYCELSSHGAISPTHIRDVMGDAQKQGVVWPGSLFVLLDDVIKRGSML